MERGLWKLKCNIGVAIMGKLCYTEKHADHNRMIFAGTGIGGRWGMPLIKKRKKWLVVLLSILILIALTFSGIRIFQYYHPTYYKFNDRFIIGNSIENIEDRYGPLEFAGYTSDGLRIGRYFADEGVPDIDIASLWSPTYDLWYDIYFDENHIAQKVSLETMV